MAEGRKPSDRLDQLLLRLPDGMRDSLKAAAKANKRTMNAEVVARLEEAERLREELAVAHEYTRASRAKLRQRYEWFVELNRRYNDAVLRYKINGETAEDLDDFIKNTIMSERGQQMLMTAFKESLGSFVESTYDSTSLKAITSLGYETAFALLHEAAERAMLSPETRDALFEALGAMAPTED